MLKVVFFTDRMRVCVYITLVEVLAVTAWLSATKRYLEYSDLFGSDSLSHFAIVLQYTNTDVGVNRHILTS